MSLNRFHNSQAAVSLAATATPWLALPDARADGGRRAVLLSRERVRIDRTLRGVAMRSRFR